MSEQKLVEEYNRGFDAGKNARYQMDLEIPLRDQFACAALTGIIAGQRGMIDEGDWPSVAKECYGISDALLEARKK